MRRPLFVAVVLLLAMGSASAQTRGSVDWIFLVDTSQSMRGAGGSKNIFDDVKANIETFVREARDGDSISVYAFDRDVQLRGSMDIRGNFDREEGFRIIRELQADGRRTHLGAAIAKGLERSEALLQRNDPTRQRAIVLFTDGKEDVRGIRDPIPIADNVRRVPVSRPFIFFVSIGEHEAQLDQFPDARVIKATDPAAIRGVGDQIRKIVRPPAPPPTPKIKILPPPPPPPPSLLARVTKWLGILVLLLLLALIGLVLYTGKMPRELFDSLQTTLEGEIEILQPRVASDAAFIGLPRMKAKEIALSSIVPLDALAGSDARLFCRRAHGEKRVWIAAANGPLRVNDIEVPLSELYDADTIHIGDARLRFNRVGHQRPSEEELQ